MKIITLLQSILMDIVELQ